METVLDMLSWVCLLTGAFLGVTGAVGLYRFPDFYTRLHANSITETLCAGLILFGLALQANGAVMVIKLILIFFVMAYTGPTAAHALAKSARNENLEPVTAKGEASSTSS